MDKRMFTLILSVTILLFLLYTKRKETFDNGNNEIYFVSFGDAKYKTTLDRLKNEAESINLFKKVYTYDENTIDLSMHKKFIEENSRGYGYWIWKPRVILDTLEKIPDGSYLVYADAGCIISEDSQKGILEILDKIDEKGLVTFSMNGKDSECTWSKMDTIKKVGVEHGDKIALVATYIYFKKNENSMKFVKEWLDICESDEYHNIDDSPSVHPNYDSFVEHRHDQSIFSLLCHKYEIKIIGIDNSIKHINGARKRML